jgi:hypothetical protein
MDIEHDIPQEFSELSNQFINLANSLGEQWPKARISASLLFAAARFNAYNWLSREGDPGQTEAAAADYYTEQYREMFQKHVAELRAATETPGNS